MQASNPITSCAFSAPPIWFCIVNFISFYVWGENKWVKKTLINEWINKSVCCMTYNTAKQGPTHTHTRTSWASCRWGWSAWEVGGSAGVRRWCAGPDAGRHRHPACPGWARAGQNVTAVQLAAVCSARCSSWGCIGRTPGWRQPGWSSGRSRRSWCQPVVSQALEDFSKT